MPGPLIIVVIHVLDQVIDHIILGMATGRVGHGQSESMPGPRPTCPHPTHARKVYWAKLHAMLDGYPCATCCPALMRCRVARLHLCPCHMPPPVAPCPTAACTQHPARRAPPPATPCPTAACARHYCCRPAQRYLRPSPSLALAPPSGVDRWG